MKTLTSTHRDIIILSSTLNLWLSFGDLAGRSTTNCHPQTLLSEAQKSSPSS